MNPEKVVGGITEISEGIPEAISGKKKTPKRISEETPAEFLERPQKNLLV